MWEIIYIIGAVIAAAIGVTIVIKWDRILIVLSGKKIAVLGERQVGKTHLIEFLSTGSIPTEYEATMGIKISNPRRFFLRDLELKFKEMADLGGDQANYRLWKEQLDQADIVFYLFRVDRIYAKDNQAIARITEDVKNIILWEREKTEIRNDKPSNIFAIGTHCDLINDYKILPAKQRASFQDKLRGLDAAKPLFLLGGREKIIIGSMENMSNTEELVYRIFYQIQKAYSD